MNAKLTDVQDIILGKINNICNKFGLNNVMAKLYAVLYLNNKPLSLNDMVERLDMSKASISINIRALERYGVVRRVWVKGSRKDYYEAETDIAKVTMTRIKSMAQSRLSEVDDMIRSSYNALNSVTCSNKEEKEAVEVFKKRLDELTKVYRKMQSLFKLFNSGLLKNVLSNRFIK